MNLPTYEDAPEIVQHFLKDYLKVAKNRSDLTIKEYYYDISNMLKFVRREKENIKIDSYKDIQIKDLNIEFMKKITTEDLYEYVFAMNAKAVSRSRKISSMKTFFNYLCNNKKMLEKNPCIGLEGAHAEKRLPKYLKLDEAKALLSSIDGEFKERDMAIITLFLNCGLRLSELVGIDLKRIKGDNLNIIGKGNKERSVHLNRACLDAINDYMRVRPVEGVKDKEALFLSKQRKRMSPRMIELLVKKYISRIGLDTKKYTPHKLRHTAATLMHKYGNVDVITLQQILGHESVATTQIYTHVDNEEVRNAIDNNPLNNL